jgi:hypothetical protein
MAARRGKEGLPAASPNYGESRDVIIPLNGLWMDPIAVYCGRRPVVSLAMKALPEADTSVAIPILFEGGKPFSSGTNLVWPYRCKRSYWPRRERSGAMVRALGPDNKCL